MVYYQCLGVVRGVHQMVRFLYYEIFKKQNNTQGGSPYKKKFIKVQAGIIINQ